MRHLRLSTRGCAAVVAVSLALLGGPASAQEHGGEAAGEHGAEAEGIETEREHHGAAHFTGDADHDGTPNWRDPDADEEMGEGTYVVRPIIYHTINLAILIGLLVWAGRPGIRDAIHKRAVGVHTDIATAQQSRLEAQQRHDAVAARLAALESEIGELKSRTEAEAAVEEQRIRTRAEEASRRIADTAQRQIADEAARARAALRAEAVDLAVQLAEGILRDNVASGDQRRLAQQFLSSLDGEA